MFGQRLKYAREAHGLTLAAVAGQTGLGQSSLSEWESESRPPSVAQLKTLAKAYGRSIDFFFDESELPSEVVLWRAKPESPYAEQIETDLLRWTEQYHDLERRCNDLGPSELPLCDVGQRMTYAEAERLANRFRSGLSLGDRPAHNLLHVAEELCKIKVFHKSFEPTGSAACTLSSRFGAAVLLNSRHVRWRRNFDLAHELFHLLTWKQFRHDVGRRSTEADENEERLANCFARNLLVPPEAFRNALDHRLEARRTENPLDLSHDDVFEVARQFDVSIDVAMWQSWSVYKLEDTKVRDWLAQARPFANRADIQQRESAEDAPLPARPVRFRILADQAVREGHLSVGRYAEYMQVSRSKAMRMTRQDVAEDGQV